MTKFQLHIQTWKNCTACSLCSTRNKVVLAKGSLPCDVLFVGEAPGESENVVGLPFVGPAGHLLDEIIAEAFEGLKLKLAFTNIIGCMPLSEKGEKMIEPPKESIKACHLRLVEIIQIAQPTYLVRVGKFAQKEIVGQNDFAPVTWMNKDHFVEFADIIHPAAILRTNIANRGLAVSQCISRLKDLVIPF